MAAYNSLPWLSQGDSFLRAIEAGANYGLAKARLSQQANESHHRPGGYSMGRGESALEAARAAQIQDEITAAQSKREALANAQQQYQSLVSRGAPIAEARAESGLDQLIGPAPYHTPPPSPISGISLGRGGFGVFDKSTGKLSVSREPAPYQAAGGALDKLINESRQKLAGGASPAQGSVPDISSKDQFDQLAPGAIYTRNGKRYQKPQAAQPVPAEDLIGATQSGLDSGEVPAGVNPGDTYFGQ